MSAEKNELQHTGPEYPIVLYGKQITEATIENILAATADFAELHNLRSENVVSPKWDLKKRKMPRPVKNPERGKLSSIIFHNRERVMVLATSSILSEEYPEV